MLCLFAIARPCEAADAPAKPDDVSKMLEQLVERHRLPGLAAVVVEGDRVVASGAAGVRRKGANDKITLADPFHIGSCSKAMTATVIAMLVEEGKLTWGTTLAAAFPKLRNEMHADYRNVTLEQLLHHESGLPSDTSVDDAWRLMRSHRGSPTEARRDLLRTLTKKAPDHPPGGQRVYANANYAIAAHMAETAAGEPFENLLRKRLFKPLKMASAGFGSPGENNPSRAAVPWGHGENGDPIRPGPLADNPPAYTPSGRVHCTLMDWAKFVSLHLAEPGGLTPKLLNADTFDRLHQPAEGEGTPYAMGWIAVPRPWAGGTALTHSGTNTHWYAVAWLAPKRGFAVLIACNIGGDEAAKACDEAAAGLIQGYEDYLKRKK